MSGGTQPRQSRLAIGFVISALCLWLVLRRIPAGFLETLGEARYQWLLLYPVLTVALNVIRATVWRRLLNRQVSRADAFWSYSVGFLVNNVLPFRAGEAARIVALTFRSRRSPVEITAAAALERVLDALMLLGMLVIVLPYVSRFADVSRVATGAGLFAMAVLTTVAALVVYRRQAERIVSWLVAARMPKWSDRLSDAFGHLMDAFAVVKDPWTAVEVTASMAAVWLLTVLMQWAVLRTFQPSAELLDACVMTVVISLAGGVPAAPGGIGILQWVGQQALLMPFPGKYDPAVALAAAVASQAASYLCGSLLGVVALWHLDVPLARIRRSVCETAIVQIDRVRPVADQ